MPLCLSTFWKRTQLGIATLTGSYLYSRAETYSSILSCILGFLMREQTHAYVFPSITELACFPWCLWKSIYFYLVCLIVLPACMYVHRVSIGGFGDQRGHQILWNWNYKWLQANIWAPGTELRTSEREASALKTWATSLAFSMMLLILLLWFVLLESWLWTFWKGSPLKMIFCVPGALCIWMSTSFSWLKNFLLLFHWTDSYVHCYLCSF
jgi:hypothetical protein